ncbi:hypothetical protein SAMN05421644_1095 [Allochromatium warmingii]|uniref:Uncharacterized protein n=2 Tax=Allochromatium warmingii TaxID=61595 RepID=A0A1H3DIM1_ALLWA|nr:hypothetical protein SAMN05421644_1095 [Allochromatium warmingii]
MMTQTAPPDGRVSPRKPDVPTVMRTLIAQTRATLPFDAPDAQLCSGNCHGCSRKLLEFLDTELMSWEQRLDAGERPGLAELSRLLQTVGKIERVLMRNGIRF